MIKLVAFDLDGTLLDSDKNYPEGFPAFVRSHPELIFVIASGRQYYTLLTQFEDISDNFIYIAENGAAVFYKGEIIYEKTMSPEKAYDSYSKVLTIKGASPFVCCGLKCAYMTPSDKEENTKECGKYYARLKISEDPTVVFKEDRICKIAVFFEHADAEEAYGALPEFMPGVSALLSGDRWIDVADADVGKGPAIRAIQENLGISPDECMAFGDYLNDMSLIASCTESYAMINGHDDLKAASKYVTKYSNDEDGVMRVLETVFDT